jgi:hypothetical protein
MENLLSFDSDESRGPGKLPGIQQPGEYYQCGRKPLVRVLARPSFQALWASAREISMRGIRLVVDRPFEPGTVLAIQLQRKLSGLSGILTAQVQQLLPGESVGEHGRWFLDCSLSRSLTDDELYTLLDGDATEQILR